MFCSIESESHMAHLHVRSSKSSGTPQASHCFFALFTYPTDSQMLRAPTDLFIRASPGF